MFEVIFICGNFLGGIAGKTAKIRTRKNFVPNNKTFFFFLENKYFFEKHVPCEQAHRYGRERFGNSNALPLKSANLLSQNIKQAPFSNKHSPPLLINLLKIAEI